MGVAEVGTCQIVALQGAASTVIQELLADFAVRLAGAGLRVSGVIESSADKAKPCKAMMLRSLDDDRLFSISQDLGPGSQACNLDPEGLVLACAAVQQSIISGTDVVILSKFGKQEAAGGGLADAFGSAIAAGIPIITAVSPAMMEAWRGFAGPYAECVHADTARSPGWIEAWAGRRVTSQHAHDMIARSRERIGIA
ncbi:hypothetical protein SSBR45G_63380 [Bradyrhizobium sp. SSBR45G]|uniref:DUF2478 domain-containing protein n=1 Tax=unclassified Bradyrhizobium TaxID=2631580 RepID=UPI0023428C46|nr:MULTISPECIES: DUF2478 domain-containing protein [unclassified Bradyrhizobium]GLH81429.1 hypothetical protein SSBR45G_63380 [Bradyrhizobium sp. SSBR45G]GLH88836.1 hypothetical protein SSBR45R_62970 [Bradyrhizobium sp. SSBR45R]